MRHFIRATAFVLQRISICSLPFVDAIRESGKIANSQLLRGDCWPLPATTTCRAAKRRQPGCAFFAEAMR